MRDPPVGVRGGGVGARGCGAFGDAGESHGGGVFHWKVRAEGPCERCVSARRCDVWAAWVAGSVSVGGGCRDAFWDQVSRRAQRYAVWGFGEQQ